MTKNIEEYKEITFDYFYLWYILLIHHEVTISHNNIYHCLNTVCIDLAILRQSQQLTYVSLYIKPYLVIAKTMMPHLIKTDLD